MTDPFELTGFLDQTSSKEECERAGITCGHTNGNRVITIPDRLLHGRYARSEGHLRDLARHVAEVFGFDVRKNTATWRGLDALLLSQAETDLLGYVERKTDIIGFVGRRRAGKDTSAACLVYHGYEPVKFAGALKAMLRTYFGYVGLNDTIANMLIEGDLKETPVPDLGDKSARFAMQTLGTEWGRNIMGQDLWVRAAIARCKQFPKVVISDVRFPNEVAALQAIGATIVKITRPDNDCSRVPDAHSSETEIDNLPCDYEIINKGTVQNLHEAVRKLIGK